MTWTAPRTWTDGEVPTAALLNAHIRDNFLANAIGVTGNFEIPYATGANALDGLAVPTKLAPYLKVSSGLPAWVDGPGAIAFKVHNPTTREDYSTSSTTFVDVDTSDLAVAFTVPSSGIVDIYLHAFLGINTAGITGWWNLRDSGGDISGTDIEIATNPTLGALHSQIRRTGLSPGASLTYKWGWKVSGGVGSAAMFAGGDAGPALMEVWGG